MKPVADATGFLLLTLADQYRIAVMMKILVLANRIPYPLHDGGNLAVTALLRGLKESGIYVHLLSMNTSRHWISEEKIQKEFGYLDGVDTVLVDNTVHIMGALKALAQRKSYHIARFISADFEKKLIEILQAQEWDIIQLEGLFVTPYLDTISQYTAAPIVYRQHNIEHKIWETQAKQSSNFIKKAYLKTLARQLKNFELQILERITYIIPISPIELRENIALGSQAEQLWIPYGLDESDFSDPSATDTPAKKVYHLGAMDWRPNVEGLIWFIEKVWPIVKQQVPDSSFHFAGRNMPEQLKRIEDKVLGIHCAGEVNNARDFESDKDILVVPVQAAAGIRIKTIKAMAHNKVVVSTRAGAVGLDVVDGEQLLIADNASEMAARIVHLLRDKSAYHEIRQKGHQWVKLHYLNSRIIQKLISFYQAIRRDK